MRRASKQAPNNEPTQHPEIGRASEVELHDHASVAYEVIIEWLLNMLPRTPKSKPCATLWRDIRFRLLLAYLMVNESTKWRGINMIGFRFVFIGTLIIAHSFGSLAATAEDRATHSLQQKSISISEPVISVQSAQGSRAQIRARDGIPNSLMHKGKGVIEVKQGYTVRRISSSEARVIPLKRQSTAGGSTLSGEATIKCDPCKAQGSCPLKFGEGKIWCENSCTGGGCITEIIIR